VDGKIRSPTLFFRLSRAMLVLSRKVGERILIGDKIAVTIVRVAQGSVRIGIEAPGEMQIVREEIKDHSRSPAAGPKLAGQS
jgi:carbon storage regulator